MISRSHCITVDIDDDTLDGIAGTTFDSNETLLGHDVVIVDFSRTINHYTDSLDSSHEGRRHLYSKDKSDKLGRDIIRRRAEIGTLLSTGAVIIGFTPSETSVYITSPDQSRAGRGEVMLSLVDPVKVLPISITAESAEGNVIRVVASEPFKELFEEHAGKLRYDGLISSMSHGLPLAFIRGTQKVVSAYFKQGNGHIIILPRPDPEIRYTPDGEQVGKPFARYFTSILKLAHTLIRTPGQTPLPKWAERLRLPNESELLGEIVAAQGRVQDLQDQIHKLKLRLSQIQSLKDLFTADGSLLESAVRKCFLELGFKIEPSEPNRADLTVRSGRDIAVVEIKGVNKSASEAHAAQLEKWAASYNNGIGKRPKGILVVNAFRGKPLAERAALKAFPDQMIGYSVARGHCLITTLQLLGVLLESRKSPTHRSASRNQLLKTVGPFAMFTDHSQFLMEDVE